jgi:hypothetical protein
LETCDAEVEDLSMKYYDALSVIDDLQGSLSQKESLIQSLHIENDKLRRDKSQLQCQLDMAAQRIDEVEDKLQEALELSYEACAAGAITPYWFFIASVAAQYHMDPFIISGVIQSESSFDPLVYGDSGMALGLGQFHEGAWDTAWPGIEERRRMDPKYAIEGVARYFCINWQNIQAAHPEITDQKWGWAAYTGGPGLVGRYLDAHGDDWEHFDDWTKTKVSRYYDAAQRFRDTCERECEICGG